MTGEWIERRWKRIGEVLQEMELITESQIREALAIQERQGGVIGQILVRLGYVANEELLLARAAQMGMEVISLTELSPDMIAQAGRLLEGEQIEFVSPHSSWPLDDLAGSAPVTKLLDLILSSALKADATELHFHVSSDWFDIRYRVDGVLFDMESPPLHLAAPLVARIRYLTGYPEHRIATVAAAGRRYRVEPVEDGESMVLMLSPEG